MKLPKDVDDLMWQVAEENTPELMDEFAARFPEHKEELVRRIQMVRQLKGSRPKGPAHPPFQPRPAAPPMAAQRWLPIFVGTTILLAGVLAGVLLQRWLTPPPPVLADSRDQGEQAAGASRPSADRSREADPQPEVEPPSSQPARPTGPPEGPFDRKITVEFDRATLGEVLDYIATQTGTRLQAAPGMPDLVVEARYYDLPAITILNDLGRNFGFTPFKQTETEALLIPAVDPTRPPTPVPGGYAAEVSRSDGEAPSSRQGPAPSTLPPALSGPINP